MQLKISYVYISQWRNQKIVLGGMGSGVPLIPLPIQGVKVSSKPSKWLFDITGRPTRTELERVFCRWIYIYLHSKIFSGPLSHGGRSPPSPHMDPPLISVGWSALNIHRSLSAGDYVRYAMQMNSSFVILNSSFVLEA